MIRCGADRQPSISGQAGASPAARRPRASRASPGTCGDARPWSAWTGKTSRTRPSPSSTSTGGPSRSSGHRAGRSRASYGVVGLPATIILNRAGRIAEVLQGPQTANEVERALGIHSDQTPVDRCRSRPMRWRIGLVITTDCNRVRRAVVGHDPRSASRRPKPSPRRQTGPIPSPVSDRSSRSARSSTRRRRRSLPAMKEPRHSPNRASSIRLSLRPPTQGSGARSSQFGRLSKAVFR